MKKAISATLALFLLALLVQTSGCMCVYRRSGLQDKVQQGIDKGKEIIQKELSDVEARNLYYSTVMAQKEILSNAFFELDTLIKNPKPDDQTWNFKVDSLLVTIQKVIETKYGKTCPAVYSDANIEYLKALEAFQYFVENYPKAVENMNDELLRTCSEKLREGYQSIDFVGKTLEAKKE